MKNFFLCSIVTFYFFNISAENQPDYGVVITPIADLVGSPIQTFFPAMSTDNAYKQLILCSAEKKLWQGCPRLHQLIAHEVVEIIDENDHEFKIKTPHLFYLIGNSPEQQNIFWAQKKNIALLDDLEKKYDVHKSNFPFFNKHNTLIVLSRPFKDPTTKIVYSAGTQFVAKTIYPNRFAKVLIFDPAKKKFNLIKIDSCYYIIKSKFIGQQKANFVKLLRDWAHQKYIAYVFGGCSFTKPCNKLFDKKTTNGTINSYVRLESENTIKNGFDCAGLIFRAAQAAGLNFPYKNTHTIKECLPALTNHDRLVEGDLIWIPGHIMAVSDLTKNLLIEARGYSHGYGIVHEIPLDKVFKNIRTYQDLIDAYHKKEILYRLDDQGNIRDTFKEFKLLKMVYQ
ncbi:MAG: hypothetical protein ACOYT8_05675 [Candidatus Dependentiae bacterium]